MILMPNLTTSFPKQTGDSEKDIKRLYSWAVSLTDELKALLCNLDSGNVTEAAKVQASNIDCSKAKIKDAQVQSMTADKLTAGTIDAGEINVININADNINTGHLSTDDVEIGAESETGKVQISGESIIFTEKKPDGSEVMRIGLGKSNTGAYICKIQNAEETQGIYMKDNGNIEITGNITGASNISVVSDIEIGRRIILRDLDGTGWYEAGKILLDNNTVSIYGTNSRAIRIQTDGNIYLEGKNIKIDKSSITINGKKVLTE